MDLGTEDEGLLIKALEKELNFMLNNNNSEEFNKSYEYYYTNNNNNNNNNNNSSSSSSIYSYNKNNNNSIRYSFDCVRYRVHATECDLNRAGDFLNRTAFFKALVHRARIIEQVAHNLAKRIVFKLGRGIANPREVLIQTQKKKGVY